MLIWPRKNNSINFQKDLGGLYDHPNLLDKKQSTCALQARFRIRIFQVVFKEKRRKNKAEKLKKKEEKKKSKQEVGF